MRFWNPVKLHGYKTQLTVFKIHVESFRDNLDTYESTVRTYGIQTATSDSALPGAYCIWYDEEGRVVKYAGPVPDSVKEKEGIDF